MLDIIAAITLGQVALLVAVLGGVVAVLRRVVPVLRKAARLVDDVVGRPESVPGRGDGQPGVMDRIAVLETTMKQVVDTTAATVVAVHPNGGKSMRDQVDKLTDAVADMKTLLEERLPEERQP